jgi:hypothetical protein
MTLAAKKRVWVTVATIVGIALIFTLTPQLPTDSGAVYAQSNGIQRLTAGRTYNAALDGKTQSKISWRCYGVDDGSKNAIYTVITVDGKSTTIATPNVYMEAEDLDYQTDLSLARINATTNLICLEVIGPNNGWVACERVYRYDRAQRKLVLVGDAYRQNPFKGGCIRYSKHASLSKAANNTLTFDWMDPHSKSTGMITYKAIFKYSRGKLTASSFAKVTSPAKKLKARMTFNVYEKPGGKKVKFSIQKGDLARIVQIKKYQMNRYYVQLQKDGNTGWVRAAKSDAMSAMWFEGTSMAV